MGALLFPWEGYWTGIERDKNGDVIKSKLRKNPNFGKATVYDWKTLVDKIDAIRKKARESDKEYEELIGKIKLAQQLAEDSRKHIHPRAALTEEEIALVKLEREKRAFREKETYKELHRERCRVWLLNSMARNLAFDHEKNKMLCKWRYEFARKVEYEKGKGPTSKAEIELREAVNTLTLKTINKNQLPKHWHTTETRLQNLDKKLAKVFRSEKDKPTRPWKGKYNPRKDHDTKWVKQRLKVLAKPLPDEEKEAHLFHTPCEKKKRLEEIIAGYKTKEKGPLDEAQTRVVRETYEVADEKRQFLILIDGGPGTGKTKTTTRLAEALGLLDMTTAYTGSTGVAASNYSRSGLVSTLGKSLFCYGKRTLLDKNVCRWIYCTNVATPFTT